MDNRGTDPIRDRVYRRGSDKDYARVERPNRRPKDRDEKHFKDLVDKEDDQVPNQRKGKVAKRQEKKQGGGASIFDLSAQSDKKKSEVNLKAADEQIRQRLTADEEATPAIAKSDEQKKQVIAKTDIDGSMAGGPGPQNLAAAQAPEALAKAAQAGKASLQAIIEQIADEMTVMKQSQKTDTTFTLKFPPLFAGATVQVTEFSSARGEFNIAFHNLSAQAQALIDNQANQQLLRDSLGAKGFALHIVTSNTEPAPVAASSESERGRGDEKDNPEKDQDQQQEDQSQKKNS